MFFFVFLFAFASTVVVYYAPKIMLNRLLKIWVFQSRKNFEKEYFEEEKLYLDKKANNDSENTDKHQKKMLSISERINQLREEKITFDENWIKLFISIIGIISPIATLIATIIKII